MTADYLFGFAAGLISGVVAGVFFWRHRAIAWRNMVGYLGHKNHR